MLLKSRGLYGVLVGVFLLWNFLTFYYLAENHGVKDESAVHGIEKRLNELEFELNRQMKLHNDILNALQNEQEQSMRLLFEGKPNPEPSPTAAFSKMTLESLPVLILGCNRPTITRTIDQLLKFRPSPVAFHIYVSLDCNHQPTVSAVLKYGDRVTLIKQPDLSEIKVPPKAKKFVGYYKIARHYKWALDQIFFNFNHSALIIVEDDLDISPDFFEYFSAGLQLLLLDSSLWCVSAWNDNGKDGLIDRELTDELYRTDFFPGLGWMLLASVWTELSPKWPDTFWDDWMRKPEQRQNRSCIRPEVPRTSTFGRIGVSRGQYFDKHLKFIHHNTIPVEFSKRDLNYLLKDQYDTAFVQKVYSDSKLVTLSDLIVGRLPSGATSFRLQYNDKNEFKKTAKRLGIMDDLKSGVPRTGYRGVVSLMYNHHRVFLAPPPTWTHYDLTWN